MLTLARCPVDETSLETSDRGLDFRILQQDFRLFHAPLLTPTRVLDLKAGSGYWADKVALCAESSHVLGRDIAPTQSATDPNCTFEFDNVNWNCKRDWEAFDLIYGSKLLGNITDWPRLFRKCFESLAPGGFFELCDTPFNYKGDDEAIASGNSVSRHTHGLGDKIGCSFFITPGMYTHHMVAAGFVDICEKWETVEVTEFVLHDVECVLRLVWYLEGLDDEEIRARLADWRGRLEAEASNVQVR
ncbi:hypothetical protein F5144DRAFT_263737 [Chaetomium tenue]|uniref:Uncharacterized protein n=1 Tax=Chaetomium tenue TaxID=1854479 RepID=A0ACB7P9A9_9PEZI|nr:hypothetical protein F5144DRAFT_263737 [Chaetomium globosum]